MPQGFINKEMIVSAAFEIVDENGFNNLTLKAIAAKLNITSPSLYKYFSNLDEIKIEIVKRGYAEINKKLLDAVNGVQRGEAFPVGCKTCYEHAVSKPDIFYAMVLFQKNIKDGNAIYPDMFEVLVSKFLNVYPISDRDANNLRQVVTAFIVGSALAAISSAQRDRENSKEAFDVGVDALFDLLHKLELKA